VAEAVLIGKVDATPKGSRAREVTKLEAENAAIRIAQPKEDPAEDIQSRQQRNELEIVGSKVGGQC